MREKLLITAAVILYLTLVAFLLHKALPRRHATERLINANLSIDLLPGWQSTSASGPTHLTRDEPLFAEARVPAEMILRPRSNCSTPEQAQRWMDNLDKSMGGRGSGPKPLHFYLTTQSGKVSCVLSSMSQVESGNDPTKIFYCVFPADGTGIFYTGYKSDMPEAIKMIQSAKDSTNCPALAN